MQDQTILAIDFGTRATGLALHCPGDPYPRPFRTLACRSDTELLAAIGRVVREEGVSVAVIGMPRFLDGNPSSMTVRVEKFSEKLKHALAPVPLYLQDEALSSTEARERMRASARYNFKVDPARVDELAAAIILEDFLATHRG